ncbi:endonuclease/exonuclease/phosphatase family protein [Microbacterium gorillae]|uniref:endonuclease/exonuclease/phosphatase family protein n=1 Tax=Microbacterium gorillae TaxID=1231063 RepID=UPI00058FB563|nr:endonuclease/exonuclease/phosphatase family protein [Microbacterium gorillae]
MLRLLGLLITVLSAIAVAVVTWPQFFKLEQTFPFAQIVSVRGVVALALVAVALLALLLSLAKPLRGFAASIAIIAVLGAGANAAILGLRGLGSDGLPAETDTSLRVMTWNTAGEATPGDTIAQTAVSMDADIVALPETSEAVGERVAVAMRDLGKPMWVLHVNFHADVVDGPQAWETTVLVSPDLGEYSVIESSEDGSSNTGTLPSAVVMPVNGTGPIIVAVHAVAPRPADMTSWVSDLKWISDQCSSDQTILLGDFNATTDHMAEYGYKGGTMGRCTDAAIATGNGAIGTWPTDVPALAGAPIDHVMTASGWHATGSVVLTGLDGSGSDHRPLVVQLEPAK